MPTENVQKLVLIKPVNEAIPEQSSYAPRPIGLEGKRLGLLDNSKSNADRFLEMVAKILMSSMVSATLCGTANPRPRSPWRLR